MPPPPPPPPASANATLPYGAHQGSFRGVVASSNRDDGFFSAESNYIDGLIYTGYRYQCVEYARRFLLLTTGCVFEGCGRASEIYCMRHLSDVETGSKYALVKHDNGTTTTPPTPGDVIIYPYHAEYTPWGHVAIVSYVDIDRARVQQLQQQQAEEQQQEQSPPDGDNEHGVVVGRVGLIEQNLVFTTFTSPDANYLDGERCVARYVPLLYKATKRATGEHTDSHSNNKNNNSDNNSSHASATHGVWFMREVIDSPPCLGWMSYPTAPQRGRLHAPFRPLPEHIAVRSTPLNHPSHPAVSHYTLRHGVPVPTTDDATQVAKTTTATTTTTTTTKTAAAWTSLASPLAQRALGVRDAQAQQQQQQQHHHTATSTTRVWRDVYAVKHGAGTSFMGATTATARIVRCVLATLFDRHQLCQGGFLTLPANPLQAPLHRCSPALTTLFAALAQCSSSSGGAGDCSHCAHDEAALMPALARYFDLPEAWLRAMARSYKRGDEHVAATYAFAFNVASAEERLAVFGSFDVNCTTAVAAAAAAAAAQTTTTTSGKDGADNNNNNNNNNTTNNDDAALLAGVTVSRLPAAAVPHDEAWSLVGLDYGNPHVLVDIDDVHRATTTLCRLLATLEQQHYTGYLWSRFRCDFRAYLRQTDAKHGTRTGLTIVLPVTTPATRHNDGDDAQVAAMRSLVSVLCDCCAFATYTVHIVREDELHYDDATARLLVVTRHRNNDNNDSNKDNNIENNNNENNVADETTTTMYEANFVFTYAEWRDILCDRHAHAALYAAAMDARADVVFAKPLWSYLCSGVMHRCVRVDTDDDNDRDSGRSRSGSAGGGGASFVSSTHASAAAAHEHTSACPSHAPSTTTTTTTTTMTNNASHVAAAAQATVARRFFDIARRLYELALPKQDADTWDVDISEYKDSCRRVHLSTPVMHEPAEGLLAVGAVISFAMTANTAYKVVDGVSATLRLHAHDNDGNNNDGDGGHVEAAVFASLWERSDDDESDTDDDNDDDKDKNNNSNNNE